jgi:hypothetical protein
MRRSSPYYPLKWRVDFSGGRYWETIAAYNVASVAFGYAAECRKQWHSLPMSERPLYRVMERTGKGWKEVNHE